MRHLIIILIVLLASSCANNSRISTLSDKEIADQLIGVWGNKAKDSSHIWGYDSYFDDGTIHALFFLEEDLGLDEREWYYVRGDWEVKNGYSCLMINSSSENIPFEAGYRSCVKVLNLTGKEFTFQEDDGDVVTIYRVSNHHIK